MQTTKKKFNIFNLLPILVSLLALGFTGYLLINSQTSRQAAQTTDVSKSPIFLYLEPFTVTLPKKQEHYTTDKVVYVGMALRLADERQKQILLEYLPEVRSRLLLLIASQNINDLRTEAGKLKLVALIKQLLSRQYNKEPSVSVDDVLFTDFIIR